MQMRPLSLVSALATCLFAPVALAEFYTWTDDAGRTHYSDQPRNGAERMEVDARRVQVPVGQDARDARDGEPSEAVKRAREKRREVQRWADRQPAKRSEPVRRLGPVQQMLPSPNGGGYSPINRGSIDAARESDCQRTYGKSCADLEAWKKQATADCERRNVSQDCSSADYLSKHRPRTLERTAEIREKREKRRERTDRKLKRDIEALKRR